MPCSPTSEGTESRDGALQLLLASRVEHEIMSGLGAARNVGGVCDRAILSPAHETIGARRVSFDVIIVGSGFGGAVSAARLAERGMRVLVLERGPWWGPLNRHRPREDRRELPRGLWGARKLLRGIRQSRQRKQHEWLLNTDGLLQFHRFQHLNVITGSGVGGGSHLYTSIIEAPSADFFDGYPPEITATSMQPFFDRVRTMLRPVSAPTSAPKTRVFDGAVRAAGLASLEYPELAIVWGDDPSRPQEVVNAAGLAQHTSTQRGDVFVGCEDGSKTTLDLTYIPFAIGHSAEVRPLCEVTAIGAAEPSGYWVRYCDHRTGRTVREEAPRLVLAAGGLETQRLLFDARDGHGGLPRLPRTLGQRFSPNADYATLLWNTRMLEDSSRGPSLGALSRVKRNGVHRFLIAEVGLPVEALPLPRSLARCLDRSTFLFCMGRDASTGHTEFDGRGLATAIGRSMDPELYDEIQGVVERVAPHYRPTRRYLNFLSGGGPEGLFSVHPLGGCSIGVDAQDGFTDHRGQVFAHPGLFVADGSLYRHAPGIGPSMLIAALAERQATLVD